MYNEIYTFTLVTINLKLVKKLDERKKMERTAAYNSTFAKWRVEKVLVRSVFNLTCFASRQVEVPNPPIRKSSNR